MCARSVNLFVYSLSLHRHSYIGFILAFASSIHNNKQTNAGTNGRLHSEFIRLLFLQTHRETDHFFAASGVQSEQSNMGGFFHLHHAAFSSMLKSRVGHIMDKSSVLRVNLNLDGASIASSSHTHPSHSQTVRLLTSSLSLGVPVPRPTQCMRGV